MRKGQNLQTAPSKPCIKNSPTSFKNPGSYIFQGSNEESQLPSRSGLFLGSNAPSNGLKILKKPLSRHNIRQLIKKYKNRLKNPFLNHIIWLSPQIMARAIKFLSKHENNAPQNMRKGQNLQIGPSKPCIKKSPTSFKKPGSYSFQGSDEESQLPSRSGLFLGSNPPPNGQDILKKPLFGHNIRQNKLKIYLTG